MYYNEIQLQKLIDSVVSTPFADANWNKFATIVGDIFGGSAVMAMTHHLDNEQNILALGNIDRASVDDYNVKARYYENPAQRWFDNARAGALGVKFDDLSDAEFEKTPYYNELLKFNEWYWGIMAKIHKGEMWSFDSLIVRPKKKGICTPKEYELYRYFMSIMRHCVIIRRFINLAGVNTCFLNENSSIGCFFVRESRRIIHANSESVRLLKEEDGIYRSQDFLYCKDGVADDRLLMLVKQAIRVTRRQFSRIAIDDLMSIKLGALMPIKRCTRSEPLFATVWPLPEMHDAFGILHTEPCAIVFIGDDENMKRLSPLPLHRQRPQKFRLLH